MMYMESRIKPVTYGRNINTGLLEWLRGIQFAVFNFTKAITTMKQPEKSKNIPSLCEQYQVCRP